MNYELIVCGTGFSSSFFLHKWLEKRPGARVLVLERGPRRDHFEQVQEQRKNPVDSRSPLRSTGLSNKEWLFTLGLGGGSNCWWGQTPRMWPEDFELRKQFGHGRDWPIGYGDLEAYYEEAEDLIGVAGPTDAPYPRRRPCPQPAHKASGFDKQMLDLFPSGWYLAPSARSSAGTDRRGICCANGVCGLCPVDAKFRVMNEMGSLYDQAATIDVRTDSEVLAVEIEAGRARGVRWRESGRERVAKGDMVFLGLNALFNPFILLNSGDDTPLTGKRINEQASIKVTVDFDDLDGFNGGTHITGLGYMFYGGAQRRRRASCLIENYNAPALLRSEREKWTSRAIMKIVAENLPDDQNTVRAGEQPTVHFRDHSEYAKRALSEVPGELIGLLSRVGSIEDVHIDRHISPTEGHILGTTVMSRAPGDGVVDPLMRHHRITDLIVGGSGVFPTSSCTNPSLTIAALSLRSADALA